MKLHIMSDLHLEFDRYTMPVPSVDADMLILAGDIGVGSNHRDWVLNLSDRYKYILLIAGNHEYYHQNYRDLRKAWPKIQASWNQESKGAQIFILDPGSVTIDGITFLGATLWTDFDKNNPMVTNAAQFGMNDYRIIYDYDVGLELKNSLYPQTIFAQHERDLDFLTRNLDITKKTVVITHHAPSFQSIHNDYRNARDHLINFCYHTPLEDLVVKSKLWIHGHIHCNMDYQIQDSRVICNPRGYYHHSENPKFDPSLVLEI